MDDYLGMFLCFALVTLLIAKFSSLGAFLYLNWWMIFGQIGYKKKNEMCFLP